ncbi:MAG: histidine kinase [Arcicella sp.]|nr:histidine kinase [Arcicella sp.]
MQKFIEWYLDFYPPYGTPLKRRIAIHATYWVMWGMFSLIAFIAPISLENKLLMTLFFVLQGVTIYYGTTYFAVPNLLSSKRFILGLLILFIIYCLSYWEKLWLNIFILKNNIYPPNSNSYKYAQTYITKGIWGIFKPQNLTFEIFTTLNIIAFPFMIKLSRVITAYSMKVVKLTKEKTDLEIDFLRTQLNPHFLLNSLNNIYSQIVSGDETAGNSVILLSDLMKYILYHSGELLVDLEREIHFLRDYINLERLRGSKYLDIQFSQTGEEEMKGYNIAPLILINYVENAFKHGGGRDGEVSLIDVNIKFIDETLLVRIENDYVEKINKNMKNKEGGVGIANTRKRLQLLYPNRHTLTIEKNDTKFLVEIVIKLIKE